MTLADKQRLEGELAELEGPRRAAAVQAIATARGFGDLSENFEYHAAKNEQGLLERRIAVVRDRLSRAVLVDEEAAAASAMVEVGARVELEDQHGERITIELSSVGGVSADSPAGAPCSAQESATKSKSTLPEAPGARESSRSNASAGRRSRSLRRQSGVRKVFGNQAIF